MNSRAEPSDGATFVRGRPLRGDAFSGRVAARAEEDGERVGRRLSRGRSDSARPVVTPIQRFHLVNAEGGAGAVGVKPGA
jgi:hypothetical protein